LGAVYIAARVTSLRELADSFVARMVSIQTRVTEDENFHPQIVLIKYDAAMLASLINDSVVLYS
jgi:hypothetical protein